MELVQSVELLALDELVEIERERRFAVQLLEGAVLTFEMKADVSILCPSFRHGRFDVRARVQLQCRTCCRVHADAEADHIARGKESLAGVDAVGPEGRKSAKDPKQASTARCECPVHKGRLIGLP